MAGRVAMGRRPLVSVDAKGYGSATGRRQVAWQVGLTDMLAASAEAAGLRRAEWACQQGGDGELAVLPADEPENVLIDDFPRELADQLADFNEDRRDDARLRLRLAIHHGVVEPAANGYAGAGAVVVSRLVDAPATRAAQVAAPRADLVVILSNPVFVDTVAQGHTALRPGRFRRVVVTNKEFSEDAWLYVPGFDVHQLDLDRTGSPTAEAGEKAPGKPRNRKPADDSPRRTPRNRADIVNVFKGTVNAGVIGVHNGDVHG
ncbi:hypothetical protein AB0M54_39360 [Actinoplanes sp. NPDC051470]|uniref:hypothetical protein n=1 Tax=Actinoplanes sp. NPDC051470 TaxID=3157224 RepID=UPI0034346020